jgi:conjugative relaxase-like TrwC/TraI family protein
MLYSRSGHREPTSEQERRPGNFVLSVAKLSPGQEAYYERSVAQGLDDYYAGRGESPGLWVGRGARMLGLEGVVAAGQLPSLIQGLDPLTGKRLRQHPKKRRIAVERLDHDTGVRHQRVKDLAPVAGFDLVFSVPKSVSLLHALGDHDLRLTISEAHAAAWQAALGYLEDEACVTRRGRNGVDREHAPGFAAAAFQHRTSRAQDPHLHTHVIVANMAPSPSDGTWRALDGQPILSGYRLAAGYLYEAHLRAELSQRLGVEWSQPVKGMGEIVGVPRNVLLEFSQRRQRVVEHLRSAGTAGWRAAQVAALETREPKEHVDMDTLRRTWEARAAEHGFGRRERASVLGRARWRPLRESDRRAVSERLVGQGGLTEKQTTFADADVIKAWAEAHTGGTTVDDIRALAGRFARLVGVVEIAPGDTGRSPRYSTRELLQVERRALQLVDEARDRVSPNAATEAIDAVIARNSAAGRPLADDQDAMLRHVGTTSGGVVCVVGQAGAGKTTAIRAVAEAYTAAGTRVIGAAPSGRAAEKLEDEAGIPSFTLHRLIDLARRDGGLPQDCVLVVDEAGMAETRILTPVLELVASAAGKTILVGDPAQLPSVGAGGLFAAIAERIGASELTENRRQYDAAERAALLRVRSGWGRDYLDWADQNDRIIRSNGPIGVRTRLLADWWAAARRDLGGNVMIAFERRDVAELNALARALMRANGSLGDHELVTSRSSFAIGDRVVCLRNNDRLGVKNGTRGTVEDVDLARRRLALRSDNGRLFTLSTDYLDAGYVRHGYALTGHAGQGATVERAFVLGQDRGRLQEWGYVALSRAKKATRLYIVEEVAAPAIDEHKTPARDQRSLERLASALESSSSQHLASLEPRLPRCPQDRAVWEPSPASSKTLRSELREAERRRRALLTARSL